jgi:hypothetical protein
LNKTVEFVSRSGWMMVETADEGTLGSVAEEHPEQTGRSGA